MMRPSGAIGASGPMSPFGKIYECLVGVDLCLIRLAGLARRRAGPTSVRNGIYQGRFVTQLD